MLLNLAHSAFNLILIKFDFLHFFALRQYIIISLLFYFKNTETLHTLKLKYKLTLVGLPSTPFWSAHCSVLTRKKRVQSCMKRHTIKSAFLLRQCCWLFVDAVLPRKWSGLTLSYPQVCKQRFKECSAHSTVDTQMIPRILYIRQPKVLLVEYTHISTASPQISCNR